jgi:hypothetical protein
MNSTSTTISIFQQTGIGEKKIQGLQTYGSNITIAEIVTLPVALPDFIEDPEDYFSKTIKGDIVLSFLKHPDLSDYLVSLCNVLAIPVVASGPRTIAGAFSPITCCGLNKTAELGAYGAQFGLPEYEVTLSENRITGIVVSRGASCGATWLVLPKLMGQTKEKALEIVAREVQYHCQADPSAFDPVSGKSPLHFAGKVHTAALLRAIEKV